MPDPQVPERSPAPAAPLALRWLRAFGAFWWDFLIGDTPELLVGVLVIVAVVVLLVKGESLGTVTMFAFPALVVLLLVVSVYRAHPRRPG